MDIHQKKKELEDQLKKLEQDTRDKIKKEADSYIGRYFILEPNVISTIIRIDRIRDTQNEILELLKKFK